MYKYNTNHRTEAIYKSKDWKQPKCPLIEDWLNKVWYTHTMDLCSYKTEFRIFMYTLYGLMDLWDTL